MLRVWVVGGHAEHAADPFAVQLGNPRRVALGITTLAELGDDPRDQRLERGVPAVFGRISCAMPLDDPPEITRLGRAKHEALPARLAAQHPANIAHRTDELGSLIVVQRRQQGVDCACLQPVEFVEGRPWSVRRTTWRRPSAADFSLAANPDAVKPDRMRLR